MNNRTRWVAEIERYCIKQRWCRCDNDLLVYFSPISDWAIYYVVPNNGKGLISTQHYIHKRWLVEEGYKLE